MESVLAGAGIRALAADPARIGRVFAGGTGAWRSDDAGATWRRAGLDGRTVTALAARGDSVIAGLKPAGVAWSADGGATWTERPFPRRWWWFTPSEMPLTPYVQALAISAADPAHVVAGVEVGGVHVTRDGGRTWARARGAILDCHSLAAHPEEGERFAQGGAGLAFGARSADGGATWAKAPRASPRSYGWAALCDPARPARCYHSASTGPGAAHGGGDARAKIFRVEDGASVPFAETFRGMPYGLAWRGRALLAALSNGEVWASEGGEAAFERLPLSLGSVERAFAVVPG